VSVAAVQVGAVAGRSIKRTLRQPAMSVPPLVFPVALMLVNSAGLEPSTLLPGFPTTSFLAFALAVPFIQGALFATMNAGTELARDIQTGFLNRLSLTSLRGSALLAGHLAGVVVLGIAQAVFYIAVGLILGVNFASGPAGIVVLLIFSALVALGFGALGAFLALRTGTGEAVQSMFPLLFVFLFISSMNTPRDLIAVDWFRFLASINPVSYLIECVRSLIITGWDARALALVEGAEAAEVCRGEADRGSGVAERPLEGPVEAGEQVDPGAAEELGPDSEQRAVDAQVLPVVALAERRQEARRLPRPERQAEGVVGPDQSCGFGGCGHRRHPRIRSTRTAPRIAPVPASGYPLPWLTDWSIGFRPRARMSVVATGRALRSRPRQPSTRLTRSIHGG